MPEPKPYKKVGTQEWEVVIPRPPKLATHARLVVEGGAYFKGKPKSTALPIADFGCFKGVIGWFQYVRMNAQKKVIEEYDGKWFWNGKEVEGLEVD